MIITYYASKTKARIWKEITACGTGNYWDAQVLSMKFVWKHSFQTCKLTGQGSPGTGLISSTVEPFTSKMHNYDTQRNQAKHAS